MYYDLTRGKISRSLILFALPMIAGNLLQQFYNIADTLIVGRVLGSNALAAVGSSYTLMTFLTSIFLGLSMGAGALFSIYQGRKDLSSLKLSILHAFLLILAVTLVLNLAVYAGIEPILTFLRVRHADVSSDYLCRPYCNIRIQFLFLYAARARKLFCAADFSRCLCCAEHCTGSALCRCTAVRHRRRGARYGSCAVCVRRRYSALCAAPLPHVAAVKKRMAFQPFHFKRDSESFFDDLHSAVGHEFRHSDGTGARQQLRSGGHGGICGRGEN